MMGEPVELRLRAGALELLQNRLDTSLAAIDPKVTFAVASLLLCVGQAIGFPLRASLSRLTAPT
jgi:hypothetical protein